jgi:trigger factor
MIENYLDSMVESYKKEHEGHDHGIEDDAIRREGRESAVRGVKRYLLLETVGGEEDIEVSEEELDAHVDQMAEQSQMEGKRLRQILKGSGQLERIGSELKEQKALDFLIDNADVEDVEVKPEEQAAVED